MSKLTIKGVKALANANYDHGGDYLLIMLSDSDMKSMFCKPGGKRLMYEYMHSVENMRSYLASML